MSATYALPRPIEPMRPRAQADNEHLLQLESARRAEMATATAQLKPDLVELIAEVEALRKLEHGWDGDDAARIDMLAIRSSRLFVSQAAEYITARYPLEWLTPTVCADPDGGVELYWEGHGRWLELLFRSGNAGLLAISGTEGSAPLKRTIDSGEGLYLVEWVTGG